MSKQEIDILNLPLGDRSYDIFIGNNLIDGCSDSLKSVIGSSKVFIITDENVAKFHLKTLKSKLSQLAIKFHSIIIPAGEKSKSLNSLESLLNQIFEQQPERNTTLIALGGGVIGDLTGFAASILLRGVNFIQIPTTLLSQVDSSVGGKTGINNKFGKNLIGSFYQPKMVLADISILNSLSNRQFLSGYAEIVKYGLLGDVVFFNWLDANKQNILNKDNETLIYSVKKSCQAKANIVAQDESEKGTRALLNLGHTFAHAFEEATGYSDKLFHGEAVAIGMVMAFKLSEKLNLCDSKQTQIVIDHLKNMGLPTNLFDIQDNWNAQSLLDRMFQDKKVSGGKLVFILVNKIGDAFIKKDVDSNIVLEFLNDVINADKTL